MVSNLKEKTTSKRNSAFAELGFKATIEALKAEVQDLYCSDSVPWIVGYSGGKDSTTVLQLVWLALLGLPAEKRLKPVHVISTDTLVENPVVAAWVRRSLEMMKAVATECGVPVIPHRLTPKIEDSFWVNLIGKGYPAPRHKFRWCTDRLKISPSNEFLSNLVKETGRALLLLGTRKAESSARSRNMAKHEKGRWRNKISPNAGQPGTHIYSPIEDWQNDDVWFFLMQVANPWNHDNKELMSMYAGATEGGECPLVVDTSTPSCGSSRFGCWVCTMVESDKSMTAMVQNDLEKEWMAPLLKLRNMIDFRGKGQEPLYPDSDKHLRDFRRITGMVQLFHGDPIHGPYRQDVRQLWFREVLQVQTWIKAHSPAEVRGVELLTLGEIEEIRRIWVMEKHEIEDSLPSIYQEATGNPYPGRRLDDNLVLGSEEMKLLQDVCGDDRLHYELTRELLSVERQQRSQGRRAGLYERLDKTFKKHFYSGEADATNYARRRWAKREAAKVGDLASLKGDGDVSGATRQECAP